MSLYSVGTWDTEEQGYTPHFKEGCINIDLWTLKNTLRRLRNIGYSAHRKRDWNNCHDDNDWAIMVEKTDGKPLEDILESWNRKDFN